MGASYHRIGKPIPKWDPTWIKEGEINRAREIHEATAKRKQAEDEETAEFQDKHLAKMEAHHQEALKTRTQSYALPGHQGVLGEVGGEPLKPPDDDWGEADSEGRWGQKPIAEHTEAEKLENRPLVITY